MQLWEILVPARRNDGRPYQPRFHRIWQNRARAIAGGLTILAPVSGQWARPGGKLLTERMIPVRIACSEQQMHVIARLAMQHYEQEAVFYYCVSDLVYILQSTGVVSRESNDGLST